ncbi:helix-turn-helix domain-containing protein [Alcaligenes sp. SDU_A2]|uniref:helix-turn-helix domain-containing protein n=1 Tax=Alcaligenes sp. SDU_A2 TaxID=3136634 RepID=UPI002D0C139C|nr:helix-turn-helix transcriptional regulator [Alcaligenes sp.]HRL28270.1 helix-turn-helix transcriptional regulator [Alcaligenes sp.]
MKHFSERLRHARLQRGLSQAELARLCNLSQSAISNYESGTRRDAREILDLAKALNVSAQWLKSGLGPMEISLGGALVLHDAGDGPPIVTWPFGRFSVDEVVALSSQDRDHLDQTIRHLLNGMKNK